MKTFSGSRGFSLIELLTVIAIIAILAGLIFPVMAVVKERARQNNCMSNLHQIATGVQMFKTDNRKYPAALVGVVDKNGVPTDVVADMVDMESAKSDEYLFSEYVPSVKAFHCPSSNIVDTTTATGLAQVYVKPYETGSGADTIYVYSYDSYELYMYNGQPERHYYTDWADDPSVNTNGGAVSRLPVFDGTDGTASQQADYERQLKFRNPPADTVITWCSYHESRTGSGASATYKGNAIAVFLDGSAELVPAEKMETSMWRVRPKKG
ncbi:MAG: DUF1559 domain-containing protein [Armatimonadota bacterium]|nr:type II secretion system GspH family protein [bacterium]